MNSCDVAGCEREGVFTLTRTMLGDHHPTVKTLRYCADHYGTSNRFRRSMISRKYERLAHAWEAERMRFDPA